MHDTLHQDAQTHLNQLHNDLQESHTALKAQHDSLVAARQEWHKSFIQAVKDAQNGASRTDVTSGTDSAAGNGTSIQTVAGSGSATGNGGTAKSDATASASSVNQTSAASGAVTKSEYNQLAQTGIGVSAACAIILVLSGLAYAVKMFVQYKRETAE